MNNKLLAIDPGNEYSAYVIMDRDTYEPLKSGKILNEDMERVIYGFMELGSETVIEMVASYGMSVGQTVFDTCVWIGRFSCISTSPKLMFRKEVKLNLCGITSAKDTNIKQALVDRFARGVRNDGKGTKDDKGWFYGFKADIWQAYALGVTYLDIKKRQNIEEHTHELQGGIVK